MTLLMPGSFKEKLSLVTSFFGLPMKSSKPSFFILLAFMLALCSVPATAQRLYKGQKAFGISAGFVDNYYFQKQDNAGYFGRFEYSSVTRHRNLWVFGVQGSVKYYQYLRSLAAVSQFVGDIGYQVPVLHNYRYSYALSFQLGANGGYEAVNASDREFPNGAIVDARDRFIYGAYVGGNFKVYLSNRTALFVDFKERFLKGSDIADFHSNLGLGVQIMLAN